MSLLRQVEGATMADSRLYSAPNSISHSNFSSSSSSSHAGDAGGASAPRIEAVVVPVVFSLVFFTGIIGNSLVITVLARNKKVKSSVTNTLILNLSVADLAFLLLCVPFQATIYSLPEWVFGALLCKFVHYFFTVTMLVSIFTLVAMSIDRYITVVHSRRSPCLRSQRNTLLGMCTAWVLSLGIAVPVAQHQTYVTGYYEAPNSTFCWEIWEDETTKHTYTVAILILGYLLPLVLITCCYMKVLCHLHNKIRIISKKSQRSKRKTTQTVLAVVAAFSLSWLPHHIITLWADFGTFPLTEASFAFRITSHCLAYGNSCVNPIIYAFLSENFRKAYREVFRCHFVHPMPAVAAQVRCSSAAMARAADAKRAESTSNM
ncbi:galanin receptor type 1-like [Rhinatrema bivittatum]|uniref:galanin receptor type 1-like n=1 Tax=Rhinatrema bivittatum TaxID=194408 RepID=UPI00112B1B42|nr:galanin receptor type 1-like [Rhinatrema bivittatum]